MKLQELLKIDTSKSNWFKIFARNGINVKTVSSVSNGGVSNKYFPKYYTFVVDTDAEMINVIINTFSSLIKYRVIRETIIANSEFYFSDIRERNIVAFSYTPMYMYSEFDGYVLIEDFVDYANKSGGTHMTQCLVEITEE